jgi:hypothetical protein
MHRGGGDFSIHMYLLPGLAGILILVKSRRQEEVTASVHTSD